MYKSKSIRTSSSFSIEELEEIKPEKNITCKYCFEELSSDRTSSYKDKSPTYIKNVYNCFDCNVRFVKLKNINEELIRTYEYTI